MYLPDAIFIDTGAWYALFDRRDAYHRDADAFLEGLKGRPVRLVTSEYVFAETVTILRYRAGHRIARRFGEHLRRSQVLCEEIDGGIREAAWQIFLDYKDQRFSFTDCTSFALMRIRGIRDAFAFDSHFRTMGFVLHPHISG